jgi:purine-binding chemotaxis protein CheW
METTTPMQILRFSLAEQHYAFDVLKTREVLSLVKITPLPSSLDFLSGVINLRGSVIPVVDLRLKFGMPAAESTVDTSIVILEAASAGETAVIGAVVDMVKGVSNCDPSELEPPPRFGMPLNSALIQSIAKKDSEFVVVLDSDKVFSESELWNIQTQVGAGAAD